jgi:prepilin-type N-terminal cleavage/methylation domain-containing protein
MGTSKRLAFTLVELLVVIAIIGILIGLLLPAINSAREAGRRASCQNNLKQLALATLAYNNAVGIFPPSCSWVQNDPSNVANGKDNWIILVLPFMDNTGLFNQFNHELPISNAENAMARATVVPEFLCPSDAAYNRKPFDGSTGPGTKMMGDNWARGDYAANAGLAFLENTPKDNSAAGGAATSGWLNPQIRGIMGSGCALTTNQITDGLSHTVLLGEIRAGLAPCDSRGVWAMSGACPSSLWATAYFLGDDYGPNCLTPKADDVLNCGTLEVQYGGSGGASDVKGEDALINLWMPCSDDNEPNNWPNWQQTMRSQHTGGAYMALADGSVHWLDDLIDCSGSSWDDPGNGGPVKITKMTVWEALMASGDGQTLLSDEY